MKQETMDVLVQAGDEIDRVVRPHEGYSGRGMYGKKTHAVTLDSLSDIIPVAFAAGMNNPENDELLADLMRLSHDSMGRGVIFY